MPKFTLIKHPEFESDSTVQVTFETDDANLLRCHLNCFAAASGFDTGDEAEEEESTIEDWLEKAEDAMWEDAFNSKFDRKDVIPMPPNVYSISLGDK